jgi:hypothetical protein
VKTSVLAVLLALSLALAAVAGFATYRNWAWLEQHHLAGLAALETFFALVAAVFAVVVVRREWAELSSGAVAQLYLAALGLLLVAFVAVGVGLLVLGWLWLWGGYRLHSFVMAHPLSTLAILAVAWGSFVARSRLRAGARGRRLGRRS